MKSTTFWRRTTWFAVAVLPIPVALYAVHSSTTLGFSFLVFALLGWLVPAFGGMALRGATGWRGAGAHTLWWFTWYCFLSGMVAVLAPWERIIWHIYGPFICVPAFAIALYLQLLAIVGLSVFTARRYEELQGLTKTMTALVFILAVMPNVMPYSYLGGLMIAEHLSDALAAATGYEIYLTDMRSNLMGFIMLFGMTRAFEILLAAIVFPVVFYVGRPEHRTGRFLGTLIGVVLYLGMRWGSDYLLVRYGTGMATLASPLIMFPTTLIISSLEVIFAGLVAVRIIQRYHRVHGEEEA